LLFKASSVRHPSILVRKNFASRHDVIGTSTPYRGIHNLRDSAYFTQVKVTVFSFTSVLATDD
jgi:hypothetical protein